VEVVLGRPHFFNADRYLFKTITMADDAHLSEEGHRDGAAENEPR
jgi:hypothetical protein